jgi:signal transduction histidine kinase
MNYSDDGKGFDTQKESHGLGIGNILTRSKLLDGIVEFKSAPAINGMFFSIKFHNND